MSHRSKFISVKVDKKFAEYVQGVIDTWTENTELEIRFKIPNANFDNVVAKFGVPEKMSKSFTATSSTQNSAFGLQRLELDVKTGEKEILMKKVRSSFPMPSIEGKISVATEEEISAVTVNLDTYRFKHRKSFPQKKFRLDLTLTDSFILDSAEKIDEMKKWKNEVQKLTVGVVEVELEWVEDRSPTFSELNEEIFEVLDNVMEKLGVRINNDASVYEMLSELISGADDWRSTISKPVPLLRDALKILHSEPFSVTLKYDGERVIVFAMGKIVYLMFAGEIKMHSSPVEIESPIVVDGEIYNGMVYVFDVLYIEETNVTTNTFATRYEKIDDAVKILMSAGIKSTKKKFWFPSPGGNLQELVKEAMTTYNKSPIPLEGLIFTPVNREFYNRLTFKWKEPSKNSIDFLVKHNGQKLDLYVGISLRAYKEKTQRSYFDVKTFPKLGSRADYGPILYESIDKTDVVVADDTIWEFIWSDNKFVPYRFRKDRTDEYLQGKGVFGNDYGVAEEVRDTMINAITVETLTTQTYFTTVTKKGEQEPWQRVNNAIKAKLYNTHVKEGGSIAELAAGRGGDLNRWLGRKLTFVLATDIDGDALDQLKMRYAKLDQKIRDQMKIETVRCDVLSDCLGALEKYGEMKFSAVSCMFAMHYFAASEDDYMKFVSTIKYLMSPGTIGIVTSLDGKSVHDKLASGEIVFTNAAGEVFAHIKKQYTSDKMEPFGQKISVMISTIGAFHDEYLVNYDVVKRIFVREGLKVQIDGQFSDFSDFYIKTNKRAKKDQLVAELNDDEKTFVGLHRYLVFKKT